MPDSTLPLRQQTYQTNFYKRTLNKAAPQFTSSEDRLKRNNLLQDEAQRLIKKVEESFYEVACRSVYFYISFHWYGSYFLPVLSTEKIMFDSFLATLTIASCGSILFL